MRIGLLTSSRADFGIYYPLVKELWNDKAFDVEIIAFGTHLKKQYGYTIDEINKLGFEVKHKIETETKNNNSSDIAKSIGNTIVKFSNFWDNNNFDLVIALGDRYEMFAAVSAASPFGLDIAHIHAGETTLGAIDNAYRHSISLMSKYLFVSTEEYKNRATELSEISNNVFNVGALSIDNLMSQKLFSNDEFYERFGIDLNKPSILSTFHPETVSLDKNEGYIKELISAFEVLKGKYQLIITMPNSDTMGDMIREQLISFSEKYNSVKLVESFGMEGYLTAMKNCEILLGNTSSGFVEAAFFPKWVVNIGDRQKGRIITENIINSLVEKGSILNAVKFVEENTISSDTNIYGDGNTSGRIVDIIKNIYGVK